jgi:hypothetical protein
MPSLGDMLTRALYSVQLGYVLIVVGGLMFSTCVSAWRESAGRGRRQHLPGVVAAMVGAVLFAVLGGYILQRARQGG